MTSNVLNLLATVSPGGIAGIAIAALVVGAAIGLLIYRLYSQAKIGAAKQEATRIVEEAKLESKTIKKESLIEAKEQIHKLRSEVDKESKERRAELQRQENRIIQKETSIDRKESQLDKKLDDLENSQKVIDQERQKLKNIEAELALSQQRIQAELEKVAELTKEEASAELKQTLLESVRRDAAADAKKIEVEVKENSEKIAKEIISLAIQRCAADHASETTVSVVNLPSDEMKGRLIGRVGRNIRALESATGVDLIIDDTPDVVTVSSFDPVRREVAKITVDRLITDGRIHPARIEEMVDKVKREVEQSIKEAGEEAALESAVYGIHPELIKILGRLKYRTSYGQNVLKHSLEVCYLAGLMAGELGVDIKTAKRAGLLHDIGKALDHEVEGTHIQIGEDLAKKYKESNAVIHAIAAHHGDIEAKTVEAVLVQAADAISSARPGARRESIENYVKRIEKLEDIAKSFKGVEQSFAIQAGREIRVMVKPEDVNDEQIAFLARDIAHKLESDVDYPGQIKVNVIREVRSVEYAK